MTFSELKQNFLNSKEGYEVKSRVVAARVRNRVFPSSSKVFAAFDDAILPFDKVRIVIVGQDPYPTEGDANGFAFSTDTMKIPYSLQNIFKEIRRTLYPYMGDLTFAQSFASPNLSSWTQEGILLMNRVLTVDEGAPDSHKDFGWQHFTDSVIEALNDDIEPKVFMLWGEKAKEVKKWINNPLHLVLESAHPANERYHPNTFIGNDHFLKANDFLLENGRISKSEQMDISEWIDVNVFAKSVKSMLTARKLPIPLNHAEMIKKNILALTKFAYDTVIDYKTVKN